MYSFILYIFLNIYIIYIYYTQAVMRQGKGQGSPGGVTDATQAAGTCLDGWFGLAA